MVQIMIIITKSYDVKKVYEARGNYEQMREYVLTLIPDVYKHSDSIFYNQCYYIYTDIMQNSTYSFDIKKEIADTLMRKIHVVGYLDDFIEMSVVERFVNFEKLNMYREDDILNGT